MNTNSATRPTRAPISTDHLIAELLLAPNPRGTKEMLIFEDLARERRREAEHEAHQQRLARNLASARRWQRLSTWAARRAQRAFDLL